MAYPLTEYTKHVGPFNAYMATSGWGDMGYIGIYQKIVSGMRQRKPYTIPTGYRMDEYKNLYGPGGLSWSWSPGTTRDWAIANNLARKRFIAELGESSSFGATMTAELRETFGSVVTVITRLALAARQVRRLQFFKAAELLGLPYREVDVKKTRWRTEYVSRKNGYGKVRVRTKVLYNEVRIDWGSGRTHAKTAASGWLLWSYGAKPLISDIQNGMDVLTREFPEKFITSSGRGEWSSVYNDGNGNITTYKAESRVKFRASVRVNNPNKWLRNQLGLDNPLQWVNEAIPFSFVVDWFSNLSDVIGQFSDFNGLELIDPMRLSKCTIRQFEKYSGTYQLPSGKQAVRFMRDFQVPSATLTFGYERFEWQRGANAISLLVGFLPKK